MFGLRLLPLIFSLCLSSSPSGASDVGSAIGPVRQPAVHHSEWLLARGDAGRSSPTDHVNVRTYAACDGVSDDWPAIQRALDTSVASGRMLDFGSSTCVSSRQLVATNGSVSIGADVNAGSIRFTNPTSAGFSFSLRGYSNGTVDRVSIRGLTIIAGAVHLDAALKIAWRDRTPNGERMLSIESVTVRPEVFGDRSFSRDLWIDSAFNGSVVDFFALGNETASGTAIYVNQSVSVVFARPNVNWRAVAAHFTTGDNGRPQPQSEGLYLDHPVFYNVNKCVVIDGKSAMSLNMIDFSWAHGHCAANRGRNPMALQFNLVAQSHVSGGTIYGYPGSDGTLAELTSVSETDFIGNYITAIADRPAGTGLRFSGTSIGNRLVANRISNFMTCLEFAEAKDTANWYSANQLNACPNPIADHGLANTDGGNSITWSSTVLRKRTLPRP